MGPHGADVGRHGRRDYWLFDEERAVASTGFGVATGRDMLRRPRVGPVLRQGAGDSPEGAGPLRGQERARRAGDRAILGGVLEHPHPFGGVVALATCLIHIQSIIIDTNYGHKMILRISHSA